MSEESNSPRSGGLVSSQGIEWSFIWLAVGVLGIVFLFFLLLGTKSPDKGPSYDNGGQIAPRQIRDDSGESQPEVGTSGTTEST